MAELNALNLMQKNFLKIDNGEMVSKLVGKLSAGVENVLVFSENKYVGMASKRSLARKTANLQNVKVSAVVEKCPELSPNEPLLSIVEAMYFSGARLLPVVDNGKVLGTVSAAAVVGQINQFAEIKNLPAKAVSTKNFILLNEKDSLSKALTLMREKNVKKIPLIDSSGNLSGIARFEDIMTAYLHGASSRKSQFKKGVQIHSGEKESILNTPISNEMNSNFFAVDENTSISDISKKIGASSCAVVCKKSVPVGIITYKDLLSTMLKLKQLAVEQRKIQLINMPQVDEIDLPKIENLLTDFYDMARQRMHNEVLMIVHFKQHKKSQLKTKHSVHVRLSIPGLRLIASDTDWNLLTTTQKALEKLGNEMKKRLR